MSGASSGLDLNDARSSCTTNNCQAMAVNGTVFRFGDKAFPWVAQTYADKDECLRVDIILEVGGVDLEMVVVAPNGTVRRNDDRGGGACPTCPLVKFTAPKSGWHTVSVSEVGGRPLQSDFQMRIGRYNNGNPNCNNPTPPLN